jgi:hypothetical protein
MFIETHFFARHPYNLSQALQWISCALENQSAKGSLPGARFLVERGGKRAPPPEGHERKKFLGGVSRVSTLFAASSRV